MIILLAVIALITVPMVTSTMKDARKSSFKTSMVNLVKAADNYYADNQLDITSSMSFDFLKGGTNEKGEELSFKGTKPETGRVVINADGEIALMDVSNGTYYANYNSSSDDDVLVTDDNEVLTRDELTEELKKLKQDLASTKTALQTELNKKANQADLDKTNTQLTSTTKIANTANNTANGLNNNMLNKTYPVGSIYISYSATNPGSLFGGTWVNYGSGRTLLGISSGTAGATGGSNSSSVTLTTANLPSHTHGIPSLSGSTNTAGNHSHQLYGALTGQQVAISNVGNDWAQTTQGWASYNWIMSGGDHSHSLTTKASTSGATGSGSAFSVNTQNPYITVYMWRRTA